MLVKGFLGFVVMLSLMSCTSRSLDINNACDILTRQYRWNKALEEVEQNWQVPKSMVLAFIHQESKFQAKAKPPRKKLFGFIPTVRPSSAYGYPQALDATWGEYRNVRGGLFAERDDFADTVDFIGWYIDGSRRVLGVAASDVYTHYLAYHDGRAGYKARLYTKKAWLRSVANKVRNRSNIYAQQILTCVGLKDKKRFKYF